MSARFRLRRTDGKLFLERWGFECRWFGVFIHHIEAPDPGQDLHVHPWPFWSLILKGGYTELRCPIGDAIMLAEMSTRSGKIRRGWTNLRERWSWKKLGLDECHTITEVHGDTWTLVFRGRKCSGKWGFFTPSGFVTAVEYDTPTRPLYLEPV